MHIAEGRPCACRRAAPSVIITMSIIIITMNSNSSSNSNSHSHNNNTTTTTTITTTNNNNDNKVIVLSAAKAASTSQPPRASPASSRAAPSVMITMLIIRIIPVSDKQALILLVLSVGLTPSPLMSMFTDMANVSASGRINKHSFVLAAAGYICVNFEIRGAGSELSKHRRHRDEY